MHCLTVLNLVERDYGIIFVCLRSTYTQPMITKIIIAIFLVILGQRLVRTSHIYQIFPVWGLLEVALASYLVTGDGWGRRALSCIRRYSGSLRGITSTHQVLIDLPGVDRFMAQSHHSLTAEPFQYTLFIRVFGATDSLSLRTKFKSSSKDLYPPVERLFLNDAAATATIERACIPQQVASLVSFASDRAHLKRWELSGDVQVIEPPQPGTPGRAEANLLHLTRDFGACMAIPLLFGKDFLERDPQFLDDFWKFDNDLFTLLIIGVPSWLPFKKIREGREARSRALSAVQALMQRIDQYQRGDPVDFGADMSDLSNAALERNKIYARDGHTLAERAVSEFSFLWGQNANTHVVLFWLLVYIYSIPDLLGRIREEVAPYIHLSQTNPPEITSIDITVLSVNCQLLKSCIFETFRMANDPTSIRYVARPMTVNDGPFKHDLKPGTFVSAPFSLVSQDPSVFANPGEFVPDRFLEVDPDSGKHMARYGRLRPWGTGTAMCKGRTFAEKEIMSMGAAIVSLWDIEPATGPWRVPPMVPGAGVKSPVEDIRVAISRRAL
ncbi:cytochrome P450 [Aspergillus avenaceus]|uniref:Cytochrome P450 n=1 Tax=Aspergillus avenaceus TaxID=36643 RepID=A0A5N6TZY1_ASPAV|nr:cytochrome P450 [Aspergillus avenaceus]